MPLISSCLVNNNGSWRLLLVDPMLFYTSGSHNFPRINQLRTPATLFTSSMSPLNETIFFCAVSQGPFCRGLDWTAECYGKWHSRGAKLLLQKETLKPWSEEILRKLQIISWTVLSIQIKLSVIPTRIATPLNAFKEEIYFASYYLSCLLSSCTPCYLGVQVLSKK